jgi:hypothetical protein
MGAAAFTQDKRAAPGIKLTRIGIELEKNLFQVRSVGAKAGAWQAISGAVCGQSAASSTVPAGERTRAAVAGFPRGTGRNSVDFAHRRALKRATFKAPTLLSLLSALSAMGKDRSVAPSAVGAGKSLV